MTLPTFDHLSADKKTRIQTALLSEFSQYPLADAQVARIVSQAEIARGAFYKYFTDLTDAYTYLFGIAMRDIHAGLPRLDSDGPVETKAYVAATRTFLLGVKDSKYKQLIYMHFSHNENVFGVQASRIISGTNGANHWAAEVLSHQTLRDVLLDPEQAAVRLTQLEDALNKL
ncbi:TetR/AcrR family transcriptional regulator [Paucilactobacillus nenjiangensis]|uniref:TetR/AcrR family transcriptional regulator n=1 Tax=Paucilactobacillus nenjiangensis TaxID=1296540 RepID=UPI003BB4E161